MAKTIRAAVSRAFYGVLRRSGWLITIRNLGQEFIGCTVAFCGGVWRPGWLKLSGQHFLERSAASCGGLDG